MRKERRHAKSAAKQARKQNVKRAAKWTDERRALDKEKKLANRPVRKEKRNSRLRVRAERFEAKARQLWAEAQRARAQADFLEAEKAVWLRIAEGIDCVSNSVAERRRS